MTTAPSIVHGTLADCAVATWREGRFDTHTIAKRLGVPEHEACRAIAADQDARHRAREAASAGARR